MQQGEHLDVTYHESPDIVEVVFKDKSEDAIDEYVDVVVRYANQLRAQNKLDQSILIIMDITQSGLFSIKYSVEKISEIIPQMHDMPDAYFAYITDKPDERFMIERLNYFESTRKQDIRKVFRSEERAAAMAWLTSNT